MTSRDLVSATAGTPVPNPAPLPPESPSRAGRRQFWLLGGILAATALLHWRALSAPFFADDFLFIEQVRGQSLWQALLSPDPIGNFLRPVSRQLYFWLVSQLGGERPALFHGLNLAIFLALVAALFRLARKLAGLDVAVFAAAFLAFHYSADVPLMWASGSQDLLAGLAALSAIELHLNGHRAWAAVALGVGLLSKENIAAVPLIAVLADALSTGSWRWAARRAWPLFAVSGMWAVVWIATASSRPAAAAVMHADAASLPAALWHLAQVVGGLEPGQANMTRGAWATLAITSATAAIAVWFSSPGDRSGGSEAPGLPSTQLATDRVLWLGTGWAALGAIPIAPVASIWSAYFYLFALCGAGIALGGLVLRWPSWIRAGAIVLLGVGSMHGRQLGEFATGNSAWSAHSHVNQFYLQRAMAKSARFIRELRAARPALPPMSTVFFADLPPSVGLQTADGPVLRWAYHDRSLRSYYLTEFSRDKAARGPLFFFAVENDSLRDHTDDPAMLASAAYSMILADRPAAAQSVLELVLSRTPDDQVIRYWLAWAQWAAGDSVSAVRNLARVGVSPSIGPIPELEAAKSPTTQADTMRAIGDLLRARNRVGLSPEAHARLAALCLPTVQYKQLGVIEAFAFTQLRPSEPDAWRKWASAQLAEQQYGAAARSLERYFELGGAQARQDLEAQRVLGAIRRVLPGGDVAQRALGITESP